MNMSTSIFKEAAHVLCTFGIVLLPLLTFLNGESAVTPVILGLTILFLGALMKLKLFKCFILAVMALL